jgi:hypothetical protein
MGETHRVPHHRPDDQIVVERRGTSWAVRHNGSFLGYTASLEEAVLVAQDLTDWIASNSRNAAVIVEELRSFAAPDEGAGTASGRPRSAKRTY